VIAKNLGELTTFRLIRILARIKKAGPLLLLSLKIQLNMARIEQLLLERKNDLRLMNPNLHYSLVYAFGKMQNKSEIHLIEPHNLKKFNFSTRVSSS
jgi:hypothetical protein